MDKGREGYVFKATDRLPGREPFPPLDEHLVEPEITRDEIIGGRRVIDAPSEEPEADLKSTLNYVLRAHVASGYHTASGLLTRFDLKSDFASDACVLKNGVNPETGTRFLEEVAFEVVTEQNKWDATEKASWMHRRGVRRIFMAEAKDQRISEWFLDEGWTPLEVGAQIEDPCLVAPLPIAALFNETVADNSVIEALAAKGNPALRRREDTARAETKAEDVLKVLEVRGIAMSETERQEILCCRDLAQLDRWLVRAIHASSIDEITSEP